MLMIFKTQSAKETTILGEKFFHCLSGGDVVLLEGALGGGKTTFIKGILQAAGYRGRVLSPTFTLARNYMAKQNNFCHVDLYRLGKDELFDWGLSDFLYADKIITLIEWGEKIEGDLERYIKIDFEYAGENKRKIIFTVKGYPKNKSCF